MRWLAISVLGMVAAAGVSGAEVEGEEVSYAGPDGITLKGYMARDSAQSGKRPGVIVVHEWWGHNEYARKRARMLAELGYVALAVDMYGDGRKADHPEDAGKFAQAVRKNAETARGRFVAAMDLLRKQGDVDPARLAAIGYCFGGAVVLQMARDGVPGLAAVVSFHGSLATDAPAAEGRVKAKILVCHGGDDKFISEDEITAFTAEMDKAKADYRFVTYPGAKHSFTNPEANSFAEKFGMAIAYSDEADKQSWEDMKTHLIGAFSESKTS
jgi:dienelactone hydrolase